MKNAWNSKPRFDLKKFLEETPKTELDLNAEIKTITDLKIKNIKGFFHYTGQTNNNNKAHGIGRAVKNDGDLVNEGYFENGQRKKYRYV